MAARKKTTKALEEQMAALQAQLREAKAQEEADAGRLARKAGLLDLDLSEDDLLKAFREVTASFRRPRSQNAGTGGAAHTPNGGASAGHAAE